MKQRSLLKQTALILCAIACLVVAGIPAALAASETTALPSGGTIIVASYPDGAAVSLNGEYRGVTPAEFYNLTPGDYSVTVGLAGYNTETIPTVLWNGSRREIMVQLEKISSVPTTTATPGPLSRYGSIAVASTPGGAFVTLDGIAAGQTPLTHASLVLNSVPVGNHTIRVELAGYLPFTGTVNVMKNQVSRVNADLTMSSQLVTSTVPATLAQSAPTPMAKTIPTQQSDVPPAVIIGAVGLVGIAAAFRRS